MKFAKHLARAMDVSDPEWHPFWINYKHLKKLLKPAIANHGATAAARAPPREAGVEEERQEPEAPAPAGALAAAAAAAEAEAAGGEGGGEGKGGNSGRVRPSDDDPSVAKRTASPVPPPGLRRRSRPWEETTAATARETPPAPRIPPAALPASGSSYRCGGNKVGEISAKEEVAAPVAEPARHRHPGVGSAASGITSALGPKRTRDVRLGRHDGSVGDPRGCSDSPRPAAGGATASGTAAAAAAAAAAVVLACCGRKASYCAASAAAAAVVPASYYCATAAATAGVGKKVAAASGGGSGNQARGCKCPFFVALLREVQKCRMFFLDNEAELKVRTKRLQLALDQLKRPDLSRLSSVKGAHMKLMQACVNFYRDALLLEDFAMLNYTAVIKLLKKRDKLAGTSDQRPFMASVMADQPFAMYPGVAKRVVQVEQIFRDIEDMCFLRTGEGMKSVMKTELTVVEAIMQLAQESKDAQQKELHDGAWSNAPPQAEPQADPAAANQPRRPQPPVCPAAAAAAVGVGWCGPCASSSRCEPPVPPGCGGGAGAGAGVAAYAGEQAAREAARAWAGVSPAAAQPGGDGAPATNGAAAAHRGSTSTTAAKRGGDAGGALPYGPGAPRNQQPGGVVVGGRAVPTRTPEDARPESEWVLSKHAARGGWGARCGRQTPPPRLLTAVTPALPPRLSAVLSARPRDGGAGGAGEPGVAGGGLGGAAEVAGAVGAPLSLGPPLATSAGLVGHGGRMSKQARLG